MKTKWSRLLSLGDIDEIRDHLVAKNIYDFVETTLYYDSTDLGFSHNDAMHTSA